MQRIIKIPNGNKIEINKLNNSVIIMNSKIINTVNICPFINLEYNNHNLLLSIDNANILKYKLSKKKKQKQYLNLYYALLKNKLKQYFKIILKLNGIGFKASVEGNFLTLKLGYSHVIEQKIPNSVQVKILNLTQLICIGVDWAELTQFVSNLRQLKKIDPYKGKGILFINENISIKEGKKNKK